MLQYLFGHSSWVFATLFSKHQRCICLVIAEARIGRLRQLADVVKTGLRQSVG